MGYSKSVPKETEGIGRIFIGCYGCAGRGCRVAAGQIGNFLWFGFAYDRSNNGSFVAMMRDFNCLCFYIILIVIIVTWLCFQLYCNSCSGYKIEISFLSFLQQGLYLHIAFWICQYLASFRCYLFNRIIELDKLMINLFFCIFCNFLKRYQNV